MAPAETSPTATELSTNGVWTLPKSEVSTSRARSRWLAALTVAFLWIAGLALLAIFTANPITLNRDQILRSEIVLRGTVLDTTQSRVKVDQTWKGSDVPIELRVENLAETGARVQQSYLLPLSVARGDRRTYRVTESLLPNGAPLIYPATPEAEAMLGELLHSTPSE